MCGIATCQQSRSARIASRVGKPARENARRAGSLRVGDDSQKPVPRTASVPRAGAEWMKSRLARTGRPRGGLGGDVTAMTGSSFFVPRDQGTANASGPGNPRRIGAAHVVPQSFGQANRLGTFARRLGDLGRAWCASGADSSRWMLSIAERAGAAASQSTDWSCARSRRIVTSGRSLREFELPRLQFPDWSQ